MTGGYSLSAARATRAAPKAGSPMESTGLLPERSSRQSGGACGSAAHVVQVAPKVPTAAQHAGSGYTSALHTRRCMGPHGPCGEVWRAWREPGPPSTRWGWPRARPPPDTRPRPVWTSCSTHRADARAHQETQSCLRVTAQRSCKYLGQRSCRGLLIAYAP